MQINKIVDAIDDVLNSAVLYDDSIDYQLTTDDTEWLEVARAHMHAAAIRKHNRQKFALIIGEINDPTIQAG